MNIFVLDTDPKKAAEYHCDIHVSKMIVESTQMLSTAHHICPNINYADIKSVIYKESHKNHPCNIWIRESLANYNWLFNLAIELCDIYKKRKNRTHASESVLNNLSWYYPDIPNKPLTPFVLAMDDKYKLSNPVESYHNYYLENKFIEKDIIRYKYSQIPNWLQMSLAKRILELPKNDPLRERAEAFLTGKINEKPVILSVRKGDKIETKTGAIGYIIKYPSNKEIYIQMWDTNEQIKISKEDIKEIVKS